jgi:hypothetical protein
LYRVAGAAEQQPPVHPIFKKKSQEISHKLPVGMAFRQKAPKFRDFFSSGKGPNFAKKIAKYRLRPTCLDRIFHVENFLGSFVVILGSSKKRCGLFCPLRRFKKRSQKLPNGQKNAQPTKNIRENGFSIPKKTGFH